MYDLFYTSSFFIHGFALISCLLWFCHKFQVPRVEWPFFVIIPLWCTLVFAGHGASIVGGLGQVDVYILMTFIALIGVVGGIKLFWERPASTPLLANPQLIFPLPDSYKTRKFLWWFLCLTLGAFALSSVVLGMSVYPDNADSMIYRLPRALYYVSNGSFMHPFESLDNRLIFYPLNGVALYVPIVLYGLPGTWHSVPSLLAWGMLLYTTYRFARALGAPRLWGVFSAWLVGLTPSLLAQATSTNDEIIAAVAFLMALYMGWRWLVSGRSVYFLFAGASVALSAGTKLHIVFLLPMIAIAIGMLLWNFKGNPSLAKKCWKAIGWQTALVTITLVFVLFTPFLLYNYLSVGEWYFFDKFKDQVFNLSASFQVGFQNLLIYFSQMILSPIADLNMWPVANDRQAFNTQLNEIFTPLIKPLLSDDPSFYHLGYRFVGVTLPVSVRFVEFSLWSAFIWMLWPLQIGLALKHKFSFRMVFALLAATPLLWLLFWSFSTLYMEGTATYFTFYLICAAPASVMIFTRIRRPMLNDLRWVALTLVVLSSLVISHNLVMFSGFRALPDLYYSQTWPYDWLLTEERIIKEVRKAKRLRIVQTHEKTPYFGYVHWNPRATLYSPFLINKMIEIPDAKEVLQLLPISSMNLYGFMPLKVPSKLTPGLTYLGAVRAIGREAVFAVGNDVEKRYPDESNYIVLRTRIVPLKNNEWLVRMGKDPMGYSPHDQLTFTYKVSMNGKVIYEEKAKKSPDFAVKLRVNPHNVPLTLTTIVHSAWSGKELTKATYNLGARGEWLPEGPAY